MATVIVEVCRNALCISGAAPVLSAEEGAELWPAPTEGAPGFWRLVLTAREEGIVTAWAIQTDDAVLKDGDIYTLTIRDAASSEVLFEHSEPVTYQWAGTLTGPCKYVCVTTEFTDLGDAGVVDAGGVDAGVDASLDAEAGSDAASDAAHDAASDVDDGGNNDAAACAFVNGKCVGGGGCGPLMGRRYDAAGKCLHPLEVALCDPAYPTCIMPTDVVKAPDGTCWFMECGALAAKQGWTLLADDADPSCEVSGVKMAPPCQ